MIKQNNMDKTQKLKVISFFVFIIMILNTMPSVNILASSRVVIDDYTCIADGDRVIIEQYSGSETELTVPEKLGDYTVYGLGEYCFYDITILNLPPTIEMIDEYAFDDCYELEEINISGEEYVSVDGVLYNGDMTELIKYPQGRKDRLYIIPAGVETIATGAITYSSLSILRIPESVNLIDRYAITGNWDIYSVLYEGSEDKWNNRVIINPDNQLEDKSVFFNHSLTDIASIEGIFIEYEDSSICFHLYFGYILANCRAELSIYNPGTGEYEKSDEFEILMDKTDFSRSEICFEHEFNFTGDNKNHNIRISIIDDSGVEIDSEIVEQIFLENESLSENGFLYSVTDGSATVTEYNGSDSSIEIPQTIGGYPVTGISAFLNDDVEIVTIPESIISIDLIYGYGLREFNVDDGNANYSSEEGNLYNKNKTELLQYALAKEETSFSIPDSVLRIGSGAFDGAEFLEKVIIPESVQEIGDYAFSFCSITEVYIPSSVKEIAYGAFLSCHKLKCINVAEDNLFYTSDDGVLFSKDKSIMVQYPGGYEKNVYEIPPETTTLTDHTFGYSPIKSLIVPQTVKELGDYTICNLNYQTNVFYCGSEEEWKTLIKDTYNDFFEGNIIFNFVPNEYVCARLTNCYYDSGYVTANVKFDYAMEDFKLIMAIYDATGNFVTVTTKDVSSDDIDTIDSCSINNSIFVFCPADSDYIGYNVKIMIWNSTGNLKPLSNAMTGKVTEMIFESDHPYANNCDEIATYQYNGKCRYIDITFSEDTETENGYDTVELYDLNGNYLNAYTGKRLAGQTIRVHGNGFKIRLVSDGSETCYGYKIEDIVINE